MLLDIGYDSSSLSQSGWRSASSIHQHGTDPMIGKVMILRESCRVQEAPRFP